MVKKLVTLVAVLVLAGCASNPNKINITTDVKPIAVPIIYSPSPPTVTRPDLPHSTITAADSDGEVAKKYAASVEALIGYAEQLEDVMKQYQNIHDSYGTLATQVAADWKAKTGTDLQIPSQPTDVVTAKPPAAASKLVVPPTKLN
jgi:hypothetical protein